MKEGCMKILRTDQGFTLLEVMIAVLIMSLGVMGVAALLTTSLQSDRQTQSVRNAELIALEILEDLTAKAPNKTISDFNQDIAAGQNQLHYQGLRCRWELTEHTSNTKSEPSGMYRVDMVVGWGNCKDYFDPDTCKRRTTMSKFIQPKK
jgi:type IV pilus modification protein PilV